LGVGGVVAEFDDELVEVVVVASSVVVVVVDGVVGGGFFLSAFDNLDSVLDDLECDDAGSD
jgi:hypothetical protein